jgi:hypothetical protein
MVSLNSLKQMQHLTSMTRSVKRPLQKLAIKDSLEKTSGKKIEKAY